MSYPDIEDKEFINDLLSRKEFFSLKADPERNFRDPPEGVIDPLTGKYLKIHSHQLFVRNFLNPNTPYKRLHLMHSTGCHSPGTKILMYDGTIKNVDDVVVGDKLMGDDSTPRTVLKLIHGVDKMYRVIPEKGDAFNCNKSHILTLKNDEGKVIDIKISKYLKLDNNTTYKLFRRGVEFPEKTTDVDPYVAGLQLGSLLNSIPGNSSITPLSLSMDYKCNSRMNRLKLLAGLIDSHEKWENYQDGYIEIDSRIKKITDDIIYLCRSLGFAAYKEEHSRISIIGDLECIPTKLHRLKNHHKDVLSETFLLEELPKGEYYGFILNHNHRYLLGCFTVTHNSGKTLGAVSIAQEFIRVYKKIYSAATVKIQATRRNYVELDRSTPTVFVLGFGGPKGAFSRELLKYPEFGFISLTEKDELLKRRKIADTGLSEDIKQFKEYYSHLKKRITNKSKDGFYKFLGYDEFVNRLFLGDNVKLTDLDTIAMQKRRDGENITLEDVVYEYIQSGKIQVNNQLLAMFENSLLICDEIHNTYNMSMKNNRGVAIQFLLDSVPSLRFLSLSATPINNSPTEVVELINYLVPTDKKITKKGFFANPRELLPGKLEELGKLTRGRISFLQDANVKYYPKRVFVGEPLILPKDIDGFSAGSAIPYLKFIQCPMSEFHQNTYNDYIKKLNTDSLNYQQEDIDEDVESDEDIFADNMNYSYHSIPTDGFSIYDIAFPNPESTVYGIFRSHEVRNKIIMAPQEWRDKNKIIVKKYSTINSIITGEFLLQDNVGKYSSKYKTLIDRVINIIKESGGDETKCQKIMIYHDRVKMSGVLLIQELLRTNNFLDENTEPVDSTLCCICGKSLAQHSQSASRPNTHSYRPIRFVIAHSDIDKATMEQSLSKFNSPDNAHGMNFMILIGSKIIKESYDFKDIQNLIITSLPINIPTLIQVLGRCIRKDSHINLPPEQRRVHVQILISTVNENFSYNDIISPEMYRWVDKLLDYIVIQNIERELNRNAIDADLHREITMPPELKKEYFPDGKSDTPISRLGNLYFEPVNKVPNIVNVSDIKLSTFTAYKYYEEEIKTISFIIKRLFIIQPVWSYEDLWSTVRTPPFGIEVNPKLFDEKNFIIALHNLVSGAITIIPATKQREKIAELLLAERIFDYSERYIYLNENRYKVEQVDKYYILFPVADLPSNPLNVVYAEYLEYARDKERNMIKELVEPNDRILIDAETYLRGMVKHAGIKINIDDFIKESKADINYLAKKQQFINTYKSLDDVTGFLFDFPAQFQMSFTEEAIIHAITNPTVSSDPLTLLYSKVISLLDKFHVIVFTKEIRTYKDTAKQYKNGLPEVSDMTPLGYMTAKSVRLFDPMTQTPAAMKSQQGVGRWMEVSKIALNRYTSFKENDIIIGVLESAEDHMKFKLRKPLQKIREEIRHSVVKKKSKSEIEGITARTTAGDVRLIERGIVCGTKNKYELLQIMANLGISVSKIEKTEIRIKKLCDRIKEKLMELEIKERSIDSRYKYLYGWWDETVSLASVV